MSVDKKKIESIGGSLQVVIIKEATKRYVAYSPALNLATQGKTESEAKSRFGEIAQIFFEEVVEDGKLEEALKELGWKKTHRRWRQPPKAKIKEVEKVLELPQIVSQGRVPVPTL